MEQIDTDGLNFLKEQAAVLIYNQKISQKNRELTRKAEKEEKAVSKKAVDNKKKKEDQPRVYIEQLNNGKFFNIRIKNHKLFMDLQEIKSLYKIARAAESPETAARRLYKWFQKERSDVLSEGGIADPSNLLLLEIYRELLETFSAE